MGIEEFDDIKPRDGDTGEEISDHIRGFNAGTSGEEWNPNKSEAWRQGWKDTQE